MSIGRYQGPRYEKKNEKNAVKMRDDFQDYSSSNRDLLPWLQICVQHTEHVKEDD